MTPVEWAFAVFVVSLFVGAMSIVAEEVFKAFGVEAQLTGPVFMWAIWMICLSSGVMLAVLA